MFDGNIPTLASMGGLTPGNGVGRTGQPAPMPVITPVGGLTSRRSIVQSPVDLPPRPRVVRMVSRRAVSLGQ